MASRAALILLLQTTLLVAVVLAWSTDGVRGAEAEVLGVELKTPVAGERPSLVRRQLAWRGQSCSINRSVCTRSPYPAGWSCCGRSCTNMKTDYNNCGSCGRRCRWPQTCCGGRCVYLSSDPNNCGRCGTKCPRNGCRYGVCRYNSRT